MKGYKTILIYVNKIEYARASFIATGYKDYVDKASSLAWECAKRENSTTYYYHSV